MVVNFGCHSFFWKTIHTLQTTTYLLTAYTCIYSAERLLDDAELIIWLSGKVTYVYKGGCRETPAFYFANKNQLFVKVL